MISQMLWTGLQIASENRRGYEYVWFTNPLPLASIPSVSPLLPNGFTFTWHICLCSACVLIQHKKAFGWRCTGV